MNIEAATATNPEFACIHTAIETTYHGPTNARGARIVAKYGKTSRTVSYDHALSIARNHLNAALAVLKSIEEADAACEVKAVRRIVCSCSVAGSGRVLHAVGF